MVGATQELIAKPELVSVIIPTHNRGMTIRRSIESVLLQRHEEFEIIVVDDNSEDNTQEIIRDYRDSRITYLKNEKNIGAQGSRIIGMNIAKGTYVAFLDSDDTLTNISITSRIAALKQSGYSDALVYGKFLYKSEIEVESNFERLAGNVYKQILRNLSLCGYPAILLTKKCITIAGLPNADFPSWQDDDFVLTIAKQFPVVYCDEVVAIIYPSEHSIVRDYNTVIRGCEMIAAKYRNEIVKTFGIHYVVLWKMRTLRLRMLQKLSMTHTSRSFEIATVKYCLRILDWILRPFFTRIFT